MISATDLGVGASFFFSDCASAQLLVPTAIAAAHAAAAPRDAPRPSSADRRKPLIVNGFPRKRRGSYLWVPNADLTCGTAAQLLAIMLARLIGLALLSASSAAELDAKALAALVQAQSKQIKQLESKLSGLSRKVGSKGSCAAGADMDDPESEVYSFKVIERQRAAAKKQEELQTIFNVTVRSVAGWSPKPTMAAAIPRLILRRAPTHIYAPCASSCRVSLASTAWWCALTMMAGRRAADGGRHLLGHSRQEHPEARRRRRRERRPASL